MPTTPDQHAHSFNTAVTTTDICQRVIMDLTTDLEYCVGCSNVLGRDGGQAARMFATEDCRCVCIHLIWPRFLEGTDILCREGCLQGLCRAWPFESGHGFSVSSARPCLSLPPEST